MVKSYSRGHEIIYCQNIWRFTDNNEPIENKQRPCKRCGKSPTPEGYDACLGCIPFVTSACCGHGVEEPYTINLEDK